MTINRAIKLWRLNRDRRAEAVIAAHYERLAVTMGKNAHKVVMIACDCEDLAIVSMAAVFRAIDTFDPSKGMALDSWIINTIKFTLKHTLRDSSQYARFSFNFKAAIDRVVRQLTTELGRAPDFDETLAGVKAEGRSISKEALQMLLTNDFEPIQFSNVEPGANSRGFTPDYESAETLLGSGSAMAALDPAEIIVDHRAADVISAIDSLPEKQWAFAVKASIVDGLTQREISDLIGVSQMQVSRYVQRGIAAVREVISNRAARDSHYDLAA